MKRLGIVALISGMTLTMGCAGSATDFDDLDQTHLASLQHNDQEANGARLNGARLNGARLNGARLNGPLTGAVLSIDGSQGVLRVTNATTGRVVSPLDLVGAQFQVDLADGTTAQVVLTGHQSIAAPQVNLDAYIVVATDSGQSICGYDGADNPIPAVPIGYTFDPITGNPVVQPGYFTFACRGGAIEKCLEWGYPKWLTAVETFNGVMQVRPLSNYHAACVHMVRADYCGDGNSHTFIGTAIDVYDNLSIETLTTYDGIAGWYTEAEWSVDGAWCLNKTRWMPQTLPATLLANQSANNPDWAYVKAQCPWRITGSPWPGNPDGTGRPRSCGELSTFYARSGFYLTDQSTRNLLGNHSEFYQY